MRIRLLALALALPLVTLGCSSDVAGNGDDAKSDHQAPSGPWEFTDGSGKVVKLKKTPTRIIAHAGAAAALMSYGIRPVGIYGDESVKTDPNLKGLDLSGITNLGQTWGSINVAKASTLKPDLIVADWWPLEKAHSGIENGVKAKSKKLGDMAPMVGPAQGDSIVELAKGYEDLAASLGADVDSPEYSADKKAFEKAKAEFEALMKDRSDLSALAVSVETDLLYVANPKYAPELLDFERWGLDIIHPDSPNPEFAYWENLSWEKADKYQPDVLLVDSRTIDDQLKTAADQPTWTTIRAAEKDQVVTWPAFWMHTYGQYAEELTKLTDDLADVDQNVGD